MPYVSVLRAERSLMQTHRHRFDHHDCYEMGLFAEALFKAIAQSKGWVTIDPTAVEDKKYHIDLIIQKGETKHRIDVKCMKRIARTDSAPQDEWVWLELHGTNKGNPGWIHGGKADYIAFERINTFLIVKRLSLIDYVKDNIGTRWVTRPNQAKYCLYQRTGREDILTLVKAEDLKKCECHVWHFTQEDRERCRKGVLSRLKV